MLTTANAAFKKHYPGEPIERQPVHTLYGGAQLFKFDSVKKIGDLAIKSVNEYAPEPGALAKCLGYSTQEAFAATVHQRVLSKLKREAVEDFRIDFEDGYGNRPDAEEDG